MLVENIILMRCTYKKYSSEELVVPLVLLDAVEKQPSHDGSHTVQGNTGEKDANK